MRLGQFSRLGLSAFDVLMITGIALVPIMAWRGIRMVEVGALPLLLAPFVWRRLALDRNDLLTIGPFAQYALLVALNVALYPVMPDATGEPETKIILYLGSILALVLMVLRFRLAVDMAPIWRVVGPLSVLGSISLLGWDHLTIPPPENCRVGFLSKHLLIPPLWLTVFAVASYHGWSRMASWERWMRHLALALVIVATVAFSGGRAMLAAQAVTIPILALLLGAGETLWQRFRIVAVLAAVSFAGFAGGLALDIRAGCEFAERLQAIVRTLDHAEEAQELAVRTFANEFQEVAPVELTDEQAAALEREEWLVGAVYIRPILWGQALDRIAEAPLLGHGHLNEPALITGDFPHFHQQYLSWLVWGGPVMLVSGLAMLFGPLFTFGVRRSQDAAILALAMIAPLAVSFLAATNLLHTVMLLGYVMTLAFLHALARESLRSDPHTASHTESGAKGRFGYMARV
jgi:hypothetical protein